MGMMFNTMEALQSPKVLGSLAIQHLNIEMLTRMLYGRNSGGGNDLAINLNNQVPNSWNAIAKRMLIQSHPVWNWLEPVLKRLP